MMEFNGMMGIAGLGLALGWLGRMVARPIHARRSLLALALFELMLVTGVVTVGYSFGGRGAVVVGMAALTVGAAASIWFRRAIALHPNHRSSADNAGQGGMS